MLEEEYELGPLDEFIEHGLISEVLSTIKSGKEATALLCRGTRKLGARFAVAKVYHERTKRNFGNDSVYQEGRVILKGQVKRAVERKTEFGHQVQDALWVDHEFEWLSNLNYAGADVPEPYVCNERAILMEYAGGEDGPAPQLQHVHLEREEAEALLDRVLWNVELMLSQNCIHGDLSGFNMLYDQGRLVIIDLPQCVDPRFSRRAKELLERDIANSARYFARYGLRVDAASLAENFWRLYEHAEL